MKHVTVQRLFSAVPADKTAATALQLRRKSPSSRSRLPALSPGSTHLIPQPLSGAVLFALIIRRFSGLVKALRKISEILRFLRLYPVMYGKLYALRHTVQAAPHTIRPKNHIQGVI